MLVLSLSTNRLKSRYLDLESFIKAEKGLIRLFNRLKINAIPRPAGALQIIATKETSRYSFKLYEISCGLILKSGSKSRK